MRVLLIVASLISLAYQCQAECVFKLGDSHLHYPLFLEKVNSRYRFLAPLIKHGQIVLNDGQQVISTCQRQSFELVKKLTFALLQCFHYFSSITDSALTNLVPYSYCARTNAPISLSMAKPFPIVLASISWAAKIQLSSTILIQSKVATKLESLQLLSIMYVFFCVYSAFIEVLKNVILSISDKNKQSQ
jgi:hypothetical protein